MAIDRETAENLDPVLIARESEQFDDWQIRKVEDMRAATYILDTTEGTIPMSYFYTDEPHPDGSNYFKLFYVNQELRIANGIDIEDKTFDAIDVGGILYHSRSRYDYRAVGDFFIDGGRAYTRTNCHNFTTFIIRDGRAYVTGRKG